MVVTSQAAALLDCGTELVEVSLGAVVRRRREGEGDFAALAARHAAELAERDSTMPDVIEVLTDTVQHVLLVPPPDRSDPAPPGVHGQRIQDHHKGANATKCGVRLRRKLLCQEEVGLTSSIVKRALEPSAALRRAQRDADARKRSPIIGLRSRHSQHRY